MDEWMKMALALGGPFLMCLALLYWTLKADRAKPPTGDRKLTGRERSAVLMATAGDQQNSDN